MGSELHDALTQIHEIRQQMARTQTFRGYRAATTAFSGVVALAASALQNFFLNPESWQCVYLWLAAAGLSLAVVAAEMVMRLRRSGSVLQREVALVAAEQFAPCLIAGALLTYVMSECVGKELRMMPGLWAILFSLGVFASRRVLPRGAFIVAAYYLLAGTYCLSIRWTISFAMQMAWIFGGGQLLAAGILYRTLEREHVAK